MGSGHEIYGDIFNAHEFDNAAISEIFLSSDEEEIDDGGHPYEGKNEVLEKLAGEVLSHLNHSSALAY